MTFVNWAMQKMKTLHLQGFHVGSGHAENYEPFGKFIVKHNALFYFFFCGRRLLNIQFRCQVRSLFR